MLHYAFFVGSVKLPIKLVMVSGDLEDLIQQLRLEKYTPDCFADCPYHWETKDYTGILPDLSEEYRVHIYYLEKEHWYEFYGEDELRSPKSDERVYIVSSSRRTDNINDIMEQLKDCQY